MAEHFDILHTSGAQRLAARTYRVLFGLIDFSGAS